MDKDTEQIHHCRIYLLNAKPKAAPMNAIEVNVEKKQSRPNPVAPTSDRGPYHAHFDCFSGAAGDMMLAACLDISDDDKSDDFLSYVQYCLEEGMPELKGEFRLAKKRVWRSTTGSIAANYVTVESKYHHKAAPVPSPNTGDTSQMENGHGHQHDHGHSPLLAAESQNHGHSHSHSHSTSIDHEHSSHGHQHTHSTSSTKEQNGNRHSHSHDHTGSHDHGPLRNLPDIRILLQKAPTEYIPDWVKRMAIDAFTELAKAEAMTHGAASTDDVHFHEVGAIDSIVDTVGTLLALHSLGVTSVTCSRLPLGEGTVWTDHGLLPVPAPATLRLLVDMPTCPGPPGTTGELVTPTAAALLKVLTTKCPPKPAGNTTKQRHSIPGRAPSFSIRKVGIGAGTKDFEKHPNILRVLVGNEVC